MSTKHTPGPWRKEAVSDAVRIVVGSGRKKIILARLCPPQLSEHETHANALLMAASPKLLAQVKKDQEITHHSYCIPQGAHGPECLLLIALIADATVQV